ncbi:MAG TPA: hypothetical protein VFJ63_02855 [Candidatus Bathyarchaeia archaeon]|nr:hypothetical protein [Candidatus Bathyarchaeia archaeon]
MIAVAWAFLATPSVSFDFTTAAVVSFVLMLLGLAAGFLLMLRFVNRNVGVEAK